jgi:aminodeoxyfutalosine deaminase
MRDWIHVLPKAELHVHLEGSLEPETLCEIDPSLTRNEVSEAYRYSDFGGFLQSFAFAAKRLKTPEHYAIAARRLFEKLEAQNVELVEVILSAGVVLWKQLDFAAVWEALARESARTRIRVAWNLDAVRQWGPEKAMEVAILAADRRTEGALSYGLGGDEAAAPAEAFREVFAYARDRGMRLTCHAGETAGAESVWQALAIGAERIGHGIRAIEDPLLVEHLAANRIPLEVSITSNVRTGAVADLAAHPVRKLHDAGVPLILNTDDPALFETDLISEYELAIRSFGFSQEEIDRIRRNGFAFTFLPQTHATAENRS